ncbi:MAG TPA: VOC family protein [Myxococcales bacterium]|nr:VOC family protein [Myxococcales bacterium]
MLDHLLLGCPDLDAGMKLLESRLGVQPAYGGVHPGMGSRNALLSLGESYLEVIAPDPAQTADGYGLRELKEPRFIWWAAGTDDVEKLAARLAAAKVACEPVAPGSRARPGGQLLRWKALRLGDDLDGLLPFFIEWSRDSLHPSKDAPPGCRLGRLELATPDPRKLHELLALLQLDVDVVPGPAPAIHARIEGPGGILEL